MNIRISKNSAHLLSALVCIIISNLSAFALDHRNYRRSDNEQTFSVGRTISDGKHGAWAEWKQLIADRPIESISAVVRRNSGTKDTFVNLGIEGSQNFEPMRIQVDRNVNHTVTWNGGNQIARGRPLIMKAYNGQVYLDSVTIRYKDEHFNDERAQEKGRGNQLSEPELRKLASLARDLDERAYYVDRQIQESEPYGRRSGLIDASAHFVEQTRRFRDHIDSYNLTRQDVDEEVRHLFADADDVEHEIRARGFASLRVAEYWDDVRHTLNEITDVNRGGDYRTWYKR